jgi:hypothetical protein
MLNDLATTAARGTIALATAWLRERFAKEENMREAHHAGTERSKVMNENCC